MLWDIFCRVIDNYGDLGVCWRLSADLAARGQQVRLWLDDRRALTWLAPDGHAGVQVLPWCEPCQDLEPGAVVIEAFGCDPPAAFVQRMQRPQPPVWINLEYLSAEDWVERSHGLPSPVLSGPGQGLKKWFIFPGFTPRTGGLLREPDLLSRLSAEAGQAWLARQAVEPQAAETVVTLFCYDHAPVPALLQQLEQHPSLLLATPGWATDALASAMNTTLLAGQTVTRGPLRIHALPSLPQTEFDLLLGSADLNFVRGEDSFVRAQWAARPLVWQLYAQHDGVHADKLEAFLKRYTASDLGWTASDAQRVQQLMRWWNGLEGGSAAALTELFGSPAWARWRANSRAWREHLRAQPDLVTSLLEFVHKRLTGGGPGPSAARQSALE